MIDLRVLAEPKTDTTAVQVDHAVASEAAGFSGWFRSEHLLMGDDQAVAGTDALLTLAGVAERTASIRLGTLMSPATFHAPGRLAVQTAQLDAMSHGRMELGLGAGWYEPEHRAFGLDFGTTFRERFDRLEEQLQVLTGLWTTPPGQRYSYDGRWHQLDAAPPVPTVQQRHPPIIIGGQGPVRTPRLAAAYAAEFNALRQTPPDLIGVFGRVRAACEAIGRDPDDLTYSTAVVVCCGRTRDDVRRRIEASGQSIEKLTASGAVGTPDQVTEQLRAYIDAGAGRIYLRLFDLEDLDHLAFLGEHVRPALLEDVG